MILTTIIITQVIMLVALIVLIYFYKKDTHDFIEFIKEQNVLLVELNTRLIRMKKEIRAIKERQSDFDVLKHGSI